ncbi:MAG: 50S ribosomal protein L29 [Lysobacterales bacterium]
MKAADLKLKSEAELRDELEQLRRSQFEKRMAVAAGQLSSTHELKLVRRNIARVKTILTQKAQEQAAAQGNNGEGS